MINETLMTLADAAASPASTQAQSSMGGPGLILYVVCFGVIFYFMAIRPQSQKQKQQQQMISTLKIGDKVVTTGGIHGLISNVKDTTVIVKVADNVKLEVDKSCITNVTKRTETEAPAAS